MLVWLRHSHFCVWVRLDCEADGRALLLVELEFDERRHGVQPEPVGLDVSASDRDGLDGLVDCVRPDGLDLDFALVAQQSRDRTSNRVRPRRSRYPKDFDVLPPSTLRFVTVCSIVSLCDKLRGPPVHCCAAAARFVDSAGHSAYTPSQ